MNRSLAAPTAGLPAHVTRTRSAGRVIASSWAMTLLAALTTTTASPPAGDAALTVTGVGMTIGAAMAVRPSRRHARRSDDVLLLAVLLHAASASIALGSTLLVAAIAPVIATGYVTLALRARAERTRDLVAADLRRTPAADDAALHRALLEAEIGAENRDALRTAFPATPAPTTPTPTTPADSVDDVTVGA